jgi:ferric-dicitrate binding protein FerR (iron transport regulator)
MMTKELFIKYLQGSCTESEFDQIMGWIRDGSQTSSGRATIGELWDEFEPEAEPEQRLKYNRILDRIHHQINISQNSERWVVQKNPGWKQLLPFLTRAAAILLLPVLSALIYVTMTGKDKMVGNTNDLVVEAPAGSKVSFELGDGTKVWLNHGSKLTYPYRFEGENRKVFLVGEAYFSVAQNKKIPFVVGTNRMEVKATGTAFNVSAYPDDSFVETTLVEGRVIVNDRSTNKELKVLSPNECLKFNLQQNEYSMESGNTSKNIAWKEGLLVFRNDSLETVAKKLERWFNVEVVITNKKAFEFTYTATFTNETLAQVLDLMTIPTPVSYKLMKVRKLPDGSFTRQKVMIGMKRM